MEKWPFTYASLQTPEDYFRAAFHRDLTAEEKHVLELASIALDDYPFEPAPQAPRVQSREPLLSNAPLVRFPSATPAPRKRRRLEPAPKRRTRGRMASASD